MDQKSVSVKARKKRPRWTAVSNGCPPRVTERDLWILEALAKMRFLTTSQMASLFFGDSRWSANKRLRRLLDSGLIKVWVRSLSEDNVYSLTQKGHRLLEEDQLLITTKVPRGLEGNLDHLLAINQVRIAFALGLPKIDGEISWWSSDWELRARGKERVIPDALFGIRWEGKEEQTYALEVDNNTKSQRGFLRKTLGYLSRRQQSGGVYGVTDFRTLVVGIDQGWVERYRRALSESRLVTGIWFTTVKEAEEKGIEEPIWISPGKEEKYSLRELKFLPYGKETSGQENYTISAS